jgi:hypothetical protein
LKFSQRFQARWARFRPPTRPRRLHSVRLPPLSVNPTGLLAESLLGFECFVEMIDDAPRTCTQDMMASLVAYNGAILNGNFSEFNQAARAGQAAIDSARQPGTPRRVPIASLSHETEGVRQ